MKRRMIVPLAAALLLLFASSQEKLREIVLSNAAQGYQLAFWFSAQDDLAEAQSISAESAAELPEYLIVLPENNSLQAPPEELKIA